jgi:hypothetical protein
MLRETLKQFALCGAALVFACAAAALAAPAPEVFDAGGRVLGTLVQFPSPAAPYDSALVLARGWLVRVNLDGTFPVGTGTRLFWTVQGCAGHPWLQDPSGGIGITGARFIAFSKVSNSFWSPYMPGATSVEPAQPAVLALSAETGDGCDLLQYQDAWTPGITIAGWPLAPLDVARVLGWSVSGNPLHLAGPLAIR